MEAQRAKRREELRSPGAGERARERDGGRPICIVMQGEGARGREEKVKTAEADLECQDFEMVTMTYGRGRPGMPTPGRGQEVTLPQKRNQSFFCFLNDTTYSS